MRLCSRIKPSQPWQRQQRDPEALKGCVISFDEVEVARASRRALRAPAHPEERT